jgi:tetratricopeptide (TPR) repeat protein
MANTSHLVITVHGIRTNGDWQDELKTLLEAAEPGVTVRSFRYGFFSSLAFLIPPLRWLMGRQFRSFFVQEVRSVPEGARIDLVAHSFGTYLAASALKCLPAGKTIHTVIFAGSVLPVSFPWYKYLQAGTVGRVVNECGWDDWVLVLCQSTALLMGMAGRIGFHGMIGDRFVNRYYRWGHGGYFDSQRPFMRDEWVPLLTGSGPVPRHDERPPLTALGGVRLFVLSNMHFIKVVGACLLLMMAVCLPIYTIQVTSFKKNVERLNHIALLTNAQEIPGRDASHVRDLLDIDASAVDSGNKRSLDHLIHAQGTEDTPGDDEPDESADPPRWWQFWDRLTGMSYTEQLAYQARFYHHLGNKRLVASNNDGGPESKVKAKAHYELALKNYRQINDNDPAHGSYALCLIDYGTLLSKLGDYDRAIDQFKKVREEVFRPSASGQSADPPPSLVVDSLIFESRAHQAKEEWSKASDCLKLAVDRAKGDPALMSDAYKESAWSHLDQLEVDDAVEDFNQAWEACKTADGDKMLNQIRVFHIRHGLALSNRLKGQPAEAYEQFNNIIMELRELLSNDTRFTPKQRRDLRQRLFNSMERRIDVTLFARYRPGEGDRAKEPGFPAGIAANDDEPSRVQNDFDEAIKQVGDDDPVTRARLSYKKVVAQFVEELEQPRPTRATKPGVRRRAFGTIDMAYADANRTMGSLPSGQQRDMEFYAQVAEACMTLRKAQVTARGDCDPQAVKKLRELTVYTSRKCAKLVRDKAEMLLLAQEILLDRKIDLDPQDVAEDATRLMAVLGETTQVGSHPELKPYYQRFEQAARQRTALPASVASTRSQPADKEHVVLKVPPPTAQSEKLLFYLWLGPRLQLRLTREQLNPEPRNEIPAIHELAPLDVPALTRGP